MLISGHQSHGRLIQQTQKTRKKHGACSLASVAMTGERGEKNKKHTFPLLSFRLLFYAMNYGRMGGVFFGAISYYSPAAEANPRDTGCVFWCLLDFLVSKTPATCLDLVQLILHCYKSKQNQLLAKRDSYFQWIQRIRLIHQLLN